MKFHRAAGLAAAALAVASVSVPAKAQMYDTTAISQLLGRLSAQYVLLFARTAIDLTYDSLTVDSRGNNATVINGLTLFPLLDWDTEGACEIRFERVAASSAGSFDRLESVIEVSGVTIPSVCLEPGPAAMLGSFGYETLTIRGATIQLGYDLPSAGLDVIVNADIADAAEIELTAIFDYAWFTGFDPDRGPDDLTPVGLLGSAELRIENGGLWERVSPMLNAQFGDLNQVPMMVGPMLGQVLAEQPGAPLGPNEQALVDNISAELARFIRDGDRIILSVAPEGGVWLDESVFETPQTAIAELKPRLSAAPLAVGTMVAPDVLAAALAGGAGLDDATRLSAGKALVTGVGAPRALAAGEALVAPLADAWNGEAAALMAQVRADAGDIEGAYAMALRAMAGGAKGAIGLADGIEARLPLDAVLRAQDAALAAWPGAAGWQSAMAAAEQAADISAIRRMGQTAAAGQGMPRNYGAAYRAASLAAAAGDRSAAAMRTRLDARFTGMDGSRNAGWVELSRAAASDALAAWTTGGLAARVMAKYAAQ